MKLPQPLTLQEVAEMTGARPVGDPEHRITGLNEIHKVEPGDLSFVDLPKYYERSLNSVATTILIDKEVPCPEGKALLISDDPFRDFNLMTKRYVQFEPQEKMMHPEAKVGEGTIIQPGTFIGAHCTIGKNCIIHANAVINAHTHIGDNVIIGPGAVLGGDAFYFKRRSKPSTWQDKFHTAGRVLIHNDVEIGAGTMIDRGVTGDTVVGEGSKLDNLVHLGHGAVVGRHCIIAAQVGIAGKTILGDEVTVYGQAGISKSLYIGHRAVILAKSGVSKSLEGGQTYWGAPAEEARSMWRQMAALRQLPDLLAKLNLLKEK